MKKFEEKYVKIDPVWDRLRIEAKEALISEPAIGGFIHTSILQHSSFERALAHRVASKLASVEISGQTLRDICSMAISSDPQLSNAARADIMAVLIGTQLVPGICSHFCISRAFLRSRLIGCQTGFGLLVKKIWHIFFK